MEKKETILNELRQLSEVVANLPKGNTYAVPPSFFDAFPDSVMARIRLGEKSGGRSIPFEVPQGYFDTLASNIMQRIRQQEQSVTEELNELAPILNSISKQPVYKVPEGYFESLELTVPARVAPAKVVGMNRPKRLLQYAVAACTAAVLMVGAYLYTSNNGNSNDGSDGQVATATPISYDSAKDMNVTAALASVNEQEIDQYLTENPTFGYGINAVLTTPEEVDVQQNIKTASDEELKQYLEETVEQTNRNGGS